jgi:hypothetical protein
MKKFRLSIIGGVLLLSLILIGCNRPVPTARRSSATSVPQTLEPLAMTRTSLAAQIIATLTAVQETPGATAISTSETPALQATTAEATASQAAPQTTPSPTTQVVTSVPASPVASASAKPPVITAAPSTQVPYQPASASISIPEVYYLHRGEFPWCLGRRFNIDPRQIMWFNRFFYGQRFFVGQPVFLPQNPQPFPGRRALRSHPATHRVGYGETIYTIACFYGDIDPLILADINGLSAPYRLNPGQVLTLP